MTAPGYYLRLCQVAHARDLRIALASTESKEHFRLAVADERGHELTYFRTTLADLDVAAGMVLEELSAKSRGDRG